MTIDIAHITRDLRLDEQGIWRCRGSENVSYDAAAHNRVYAIEERSFWFRHRSACIVNLVRGFPPPGRAVFDVGGGNGMIGLALQSAGFDAALIEPGIDGARNARQRGLEHVICGTLKTANIVPGALPAVGLFDVIEHTDDAAFLASVHTAMAAGGMLYATVPAYRWLWSHSDEEAGHYRRYGLSDFCRTLEDAGFATRFASYFFRPLPPLIYACRTLPYRLGLRRNGEGGNGEGGNGDGGNDKTGHDETGNGETGNGETGNDKAVREHAAAGYTVRALLDALLSSEVANLRARKPMRFGGSCIVAATAL